MSLPKIKIIGTGGTIASKGSSSASTAGYSIGLTVQDLIEAVPNLATIADIDFEQISNVPSRNITYKELISLYHEVNRVIESDEYVGVVITHGTGTTEETSFFLDCVFQTSKPIVITNAMRPSTAISADGAMNLYQAVKVASNPDSRDRGVLVHANDRISSGYWTTKAHANTVDTFRSTEMGYLGIFIDDEVHYYYPPVRPLGYHYFDLNGIKNHQDIQKVVVLYEHQGSSPEFVQFAVDSLGAKGIIWAAEGAGSISTLNHEASQAVYDHYGTVIVYSKRGIDGAVPARNVPHFGIASGSINPQKSRILLQLCLYKKYNVDEIRSIFKKVHGG